MIKKLKNLILLAFAGSTLFAPVLLPAIASASVNNAITQGVCQGVNNAVSGGNGTGCGTAGQGNTDLSVIAKKIINILSIIVGIVAVIMIIWGGFKYITSGGDTGNVSGAKNTLIFAIVGLIIVALAQFIVHFVLNTATQSVTTT
jgi:hypothetical protein